MQAPHRRPRPSQVGVIRGKAVRGAWHCANRAAPHRIAFVANGGCTPTKNIAEVAAVDQQVGAIAVEIAGGLAPSSLQARSELGGEAARTSSTLLRWAIAIPVAPLEGPRDH